MDRTWPLQSKWEGEGAHPDALGLLPARDGALLACARAGHVCLSSARVGPQQSLIWSSPRAWAGQSRALQGEWLAASDEYRCHLRMLHYACIAGRWLALNSTRGKPRTAGQPAKLRVAMPAFVSTRWQQRRQSAGAQWQQQRTLFPPCSPPKTCRLSTSLVLP